MVDGGRVVEFSTYQTEIIVETSNLLGRCFVVACMCTEIREFVDMYAMPFGKEPVEQLSHLYSVSVLKAAVGPGEQFLTCSHVYLVAHEHTFQDSWPARAGLSPAQQRQCMVETMGASSEVQELVAVRCIGRKGRRDEEKGADFG